MRHELRVVDLINCSLALRQVLSDITFSPVSFEHFIFFFTLLRLLMYRMCMDCNGIGFLRLEVIGYEFSLS